MAFIQMRSKEVIKRTTESEKNYRLMKRVTRIVGGAGLSSLTWKVEFFFKSAYHSETVKEENKHSFL